MKKFCSHPVFLQILCLVLIMFLIHSSFENKSYEKMAIEMLRDNMSESIEELQRNNSQLLGIYMSGKIPEDFEVDSDYMNQLWNIDRELDSALGIQHRPFDWFYIEKVEWNIDDMARNKVLSQEDLDYIEDVREVNQGIINAYYDIIGEEKVDFRIGYTDRSKVIGIYKELIERAKIIAASDVYTRIYDYEVVEMESEMPLVENAISLEDDQKIAEDFTKKVTDEIPEFQVEEDEYDYEFEKKSTETFEDGIYNISVDKTGSKMRAHLTCWGGNGAYSETMIDENAKAYIDMLVPDHYRMYDKTLTYDEQKLEEISYAFIYSDDTYYDASRIIYVEVSNQGDLLCFEQGFNEDIINMPNLVSEDQIQASIKGNGFLRMILVRSEQDQMEYWVYMKSNGATYTLIFDAITGEQKEVLSKSPIYYNIKNI